MKAWCLLLFLSTVLPASAADKPFFGTRETITDALGDVSEPVEQARAALPKMEVRRFKKDGWIVIVYFMGDFSGRVIVSKQDGAALTDQEIAALLTPIRADWRKWELPNRRAWYNGDKGGPLYALTTKDNKALEVLTYRYLRELGEQTWLDSTEPK